MKNHSNNYGWAESGVSGENQLLSERELEVLHWLAVGASNREIARCLYITESTVKRHIYNIFGKLNVRNRTQATLQALKLGLNPQPYLLNLWEGSREEFQTQELHFNKPRGSI